MSIDTTETGGRDPLDEGTGAMGPGAIGVLLRSRLALGLKPLMAPALVFVPLGLALGPFGLRLISTQAITHLEPVVTMALAALGIFVGMGLELRGARDRRLFAVASIEAMLTVAAVAGTTLFLLQRWGLQLDAGSMLVATMLGIAASVSSAGAADDTGGRGQDSATRVADLDDGIAVVAGAVAVAAVTYPSPSSLVLVVSLTALAGVLTGLVGWLLFERAHTDAERAVFVLGAIALAGGSAAYLRSSPLLAGVVAGAVWRHLPGHADQIVRVDVGRFQHPLVVLLLVVAGASVEFSLVALWLVGPFVVFRLMGKVVGAMVGARLVPELRAADLAAHLLRPGLLGISLALNFVQVGSSSAAVAVATTVAAGTLLSELLGFVVLPQHKSS